MRRQNNSLKLWVMRLATVVLIPAFFIGLLEGALRIIGFGFPTSFFVEETVEEETYLFSNHQFTFRFFPRALARSILPNKIPTEKPKDNYRIFIFGESAANGDPDPAYGFGRHMEILLEERFPETDFEIIVTAVTAINSHVILPIAQDCAKRDGDLWIVYMGNNEMIGPYGASTVFGSKAPPLPFVRASIAVSGTRIGQAIKGLSENIRSNSENPDSWGGINMFTENLLHPHDPAREQVYSNFRENLDDILSAGTKAGVPILLSTVSSNLRDCAPFASLNAKDLTDAELAEWNSHYNRGKDLEASEQYAEAIGTYLRAAEIDPDYAELQFRLGRCYGLAGNLEKARKAILRSRDCDALAVRADSTINSIIREAATRVEKAVRLVDSEQLLAANSPGGMPGREFFYEHVHFNMAGNYQLALVFAERIVPMLPDQIRQQDQKEWLDAGPCQLELAATFWDQERLWLEMFERQSTPPFDQRYMNNDNLAHCQEQATAFSSRITPGLAPMVYDRALSKRPDDYHLHTRFGHYLQLNDDFPAAIEQFKWVAETFPDFEGAHQDLGLAQFLDKRFDPARKSFERVLEINPQYGRAHKAIALIDQQTNP